MKKVEVKKDDKICGTASPGDISHSDNFPDNVSIHGYIKFDSEKCSACKACLKTCERASGRQAPDLADSEHAFSVDLSGECSMCGNCVDSCPSGALSDVISSAASTDGELKVCRLCGGMCRLAVRISENKASAVSVKDKSGRSGYLCEYGRYGLPLIYSCAEKDRSASEEAAVLKISSIISEVIDKYGRDAVGVFVSPSLSDEDIYAAAEFAKASVGTDCVSSLSFLNDANEFDGEIYAIKASASLEDVAKSNLIFAVSGDIETASFRAALTIREAVLGGTRLACIGKPEKGLEHFAGMVLDYDSPESVIFGLLADDETAALFKERKTKITAVCPSSQFHLAGLLLKLLQKYESVDGEGRGLLLLNSGANTEGIVKYGAYPSIFPFEYLGCSDAPDYFKKIWKIEDLPKKCRSINKLRCCIFIGEEPEDGAISDRTIALSFAETDFSEKADVSIPIDLCGEGDVKRILNRVSEELRGRSLTDFKASVSQFEKRAETENFNLTVVERQDSKKYNSVVKKYLKIKKGLFDYD